MNSLSEYFLAAEQEPVTMWHFITVQFPIMALARLKLAHWLMIMMIGWDYYISLNTDSGKSGK